MMTEPSPSPLFSRRFPLMLALVMLAIMSVFFPVPARAGEGDAAMETVVTSPQKASSQGLPLPRFVTLSAGEVNIRTGPGIRYPIRLVVRRQGLPVEVTHEFDVWRQIRDREGDQGWVHKSMLSGRRSVVVMGTSHHILRRRPDADARPVVRLEPGVIASLETCRGDWCRLGIGGYTGWIARAHLWGVYADERFRD